MVAIAREKARRFRVHAAARLSFHASEWMARYKRRAMALEMRGPDPAFHAGA
jgi:hypothetical protein